MMSSSGARRKQRNQHNQSASSDASKNGSPGPHGSATSGNDFTHSQNGTAQGQNGVPNFQSSGAAAGHTVDQHGNFGPRNLPQGPNGDWGQGIWSSGLAGSDVRGSSSQQGLNSTNWNPSIPQNFNFFQEENQSLRHGSSASIASGNSVFSNYREQEEEEMEETTQRPKKRRKRLLRAIRPVKHGQNEELPAPIASSEEEEINGPFKLRRGDKVKITLPYDTVKEIQQKTGGSWNETAMNQCFVEEGRVVDFKENGHVLVYYPDTRHGGYRWAFDPMVFTLVGRESRSENENENPQYSSTVPCEDMQASASQPDTLRGSHVDTEGNDLCGLMQGFGVQQPPLNPSGAPPRRSEMSTRGTGMLQQTTNCTTAVSLIERSTVLQASAMPGQVLQAGVMSGHLGSNYSSSNAMIQAADSRSHMGESSTTSGQHQVDRETDASMSSESSTLTLVSSNSSRPMYGSIQAGSSAAAFQSTSPVDAAANYSPQTMRQAFRDHLGWATGSTASGEEHPMDQCYQRPGDEMRGLDHMASNLSLLDEEDMPSAHRSSMDDIVQHQNRSSRFPRASSSCIDIPAMNSSQRMPDFDKVTEATLKNMSTDDLSRVLKMRDRINKFCEPRFEENLPIPAHLNMSSGSETFEQDFQAGHNSDNAHCNLDVHYLPTPPDHSMSSVNTQNG